MSGVDFDREIAQIYRDMELYLIESMQRNLARHLAEEADAGLRYPQWQAEKLKELETLPTREPADYQQPNSRSVGQSIGAYESGAAARLEA